MIKKALKQNPSQPKKARMLKKNKILNPPRKLILKNQLI